MRFKDSWSHWLPKQTEHNAQQAAEKTSVLLSPNAGRVLAGLVVFGATLLLFTRTPEPEQPVLNPAVVAPTATASLKSAESAMERELRTILGCIAQAGNVWVYITMETGAERVIAEEITTQQTMESGDKSTAQVTDRRESRRPVTVRDDAAKVEQPIVLVQIEPRIRGVVIVADGAALPHVRYQLGQAAQTALGLPAHRVSVFASH